MQDFTPEYSCFDELCEINICKVFENLFYVKKSFFQIFYLCLLKFDTSKKKPFPIIITGEICLKQIFSHFISLKHIVVMS